MGSPGRREAEVAVGRCRRDAPARGALQKSMLHEEGLVHLLDRVRVLADRRSYGVQPDWTAIKFLDDRLEDARVHVVEPELVDVEHGESLVARPLR